jgi:hypothetical protein
MLDLCWIYKEKEEKEKKNKMKTLLLDALYTVSGDSLLQRCNIFNYFLALFYLKGFYSRNEVTLISVKIQI